MNSWFRFGLPLGSAMVVIAILNSVFALQSFANLMEVMIIQDHFYVRKDSFPLASVIVSFILTTYLWLAVIFKGRGGHLSIWIAGNLIVLLLHIVISSWNLLAFLSTNDSLYWRKLWNLIVSSIVFEIYLISIAIRAANVMWQKGGQSSISTSNLRQSPVAPVGFDFKKFLQFYANDLELTVQAFIILDITFSTHTLITLKIPEAIFESKNYGLIPGGTAILVLIEDTVLRLIRVAVGVVAFWLIVHKQSNRKNLIRIIICFLILITLSTLIYLFLFGSFEELSTAERFYQMSFTFDIVFRLLIVYLLVSHMEKPKMLVMSSATWSNINIDDENSFIDTTTTS